MRPNWNVKLDKISESILMAEEDMRVRGCVIAASAGPLRWEKLPTTGRYRIMMGDKPLVDCAIAERASGLKHITTLMDAADDVMDNLEISP